MIRMNELSNPQNFCRFPDFDAKLCLKMCHLCASTAHILNPNVHSFSPQNLRPLNEVQIPNGKNCERSEKSIKFDKCLFI